MVLTNFEFWAADGGSSSLPSSAASLEFEPARHLNPFDPHVVPHVPVSNVTHMSSNGYYGYSYINAAHEMELSNNNNIDMINNNNNNSNNLNHSQNNNNNCTATHNFMANDVNGMNNTTSQQQQPSHVYANLIHHGAAPPPAGTVSRCKKRFFVVCDNDDIGADASVKCSADRNVSAKRCRFDDDFAAQYCNDFFSLPSTQIATQSCLMDTEEGLPLQQQQQHHQQLHQLQPQVVGDEAMLENNNDVGFNNNNNNAEKYKQSILHLQLQHQQQQQQQSQLLHSQETPTTLQQQQLYQQQQQQEYPQQQQQTQPLSYHQQQHYQDMIICNTTNQQNHMKRLLHDTWSHSKTLSNNVTFSKKSLRHPQSSNDFQIKSLVDDHVDVDANRNSHDNDETKIDDATLFSYIHGGAIYNGAI